MRESPWLACRRTLGKARKATLQDFRMARFFGLTALGALIVRTAGDERLEARFARVLLFG
jgi:hypothetical protein